MDNTERTNDWNADVARVSGELASRLRARGIDISDEDSPEDIATLSEAVEEFERAVEECGGDLMVDEPPPGARPQPDDPRFLLPKRSVDESVSQYVVRIGSAANALRERE